MNLKDYVASIVDFPKKGIIFRDVTPIMQDKDAYLYTTNCLSKLVKESNANVVIGPEARGFMFGCPVAVMCNCGFVPVRKPGKLPRETITEEYSLEYGIDLVDLKGRELLHDYKVYSLLEYEGE